MATKCLGPQHPKTYLADWSFIYPFPLPDASRELLDRRMEMGSTWKARIVAIGMFAATGEIAMAGWIATSACLRNASLFPSPVDYVA
jgi:hypothetical protein